MFFGYRVIKFGEIFSSRTGNPYREGPGENFNHAPSTVKTSEGVIRVVWFSGSWEGHHDQRILGSVSKDGGETWSTPKVIQDTPYISDYDPAFVAGKKHLFLFYSLKRLWEPKLAGEKRGFLGLFLKKSADGGKTWTDPIKIASNLAPRSNGLRLENADLILPCYTYPGAKICILRSVDEGEYWVQQPVIDSDADLAEPTIVETASGCLLMVLRSKTGRIWQTRSEDNGLSWSDPVSMDLEANDSSHHLIKTGSNSILLVYNPCRIHERSPLVIRESKDQGQTWSDPFELDRVEDTQTNHSPVHPSRVDRAVCYPSVCELDKNQLLVVWSRYLIDEKKHKGDIVFAKLRTFNRD